MKKYYFGVVLSLITSIVLANDIYIAQVGDTLDLDIVQDGQNNTIGTSSQDVVLGSQGNASDSMTFNITQTGNTNSITAQILGATYTGTWAFTGNNNAVALLCSSSSAANCGTVTLNITAVGNAQAYTINIGQSASAAGAIVNFTVTDSNNVIATDIEGTSAVVTVTIAGSSSSASANSSLDIDVAGNGDIIGHTMTFAATGRGHVVVLNQSGINDNLIDLTTNGDGHAINIIQRD
tara:strand:+ start:13732 stop:14439 length:708 start_codon:yes stop_codon:yes gene_type:complete